MAFAPKGRCVRCGARKPLDLKGSKWVMSSHNIRILGRVNPECEGTGKAPQ